MDVETLISNLVSSLAWPVAAVVIVVALRPSLARMLADVRSLRWRDLEAQFGEDLARVHLIADETDSVSSALLVGQEPELEDADTLLKLAEIAPRAAVMESWAELEAAARAALQDSDLQEDQPPHAGNMADALLQADVLDEPALRIFNILRGLRDRAAHAPHFTIDSDEALDYARLARGLSQSLRKPATSGR